MTMKTSILNRPGLLVMAAMAFAAALCAVFAPGLLLNHLDVASGALMLANAPALAPEMKAVAEAITKTFEEFKSANEARLKAIESKGYAPVDTVAKVDTINTELNKLSADLADVAKRLARPAAGGESKGVLTPEQLEHKQAIASYLRKGDKSEALEREVKAMHSGSDPDGGYLVGTEMDTAIDRIASAETAMRGLAMVRTIGKKSYTKLLRTSGMSGGWVGEQEDSSETTGPKHAEIVIDAQRMYVEPWVTNDMLEDSDYDLEGELTDEAGIAFSEAEGSAFISGDGIKKPRGFLAYPPVANASYAWGKLGFIVSGGASSFASSNPGDALISLQHSLKQRYRPGAAWLMNDATLGIVRQMKDGSGNFYLWQPDPLAGFGGRLLGSPVATDDYMPTVASNAFPIAYGNFKRGYTIVDRRGIAVIRDNVTKKGTTKFFFSRRVGGGVTHFEAIKLLKIST
jgi:HK97 family phage major capsid protein